MPDWQRDCTLEVQGGMRHSSSSKQPTVFTLQVHEKTSGAFVASFTLSGDEFMRIVSGGMLDVPGKIATSGSYDRWHKVPVRDTINVPQKVTKSLWGDKAMRAATDWYEDQPGSANVDVYYARYDSEHRSHYIVTTTYVDEEVYERERILTEESEEPDMDDDGLDSDDDEDDD